MLLFFITFGYISRYCKSLKYFLESMKQKKLFSRKMDLPNPFKEKRTFLGVNDKLERLLRKVVERIFSLLWEYKE